MALIDRLRHTIAIERPTWAEDRSDRTPPSATWSVIATVRAWIQPHRSDRATEAQALSGAGPVSTTHRVFMLPTDIRGSDVIHLVPDDGRRFEVVIVDDAAGKGDHLEVRTRLLVAGGA